MITDKDGDSKLISVVFNQYKLLLCCAKISSRNFNLCTQVSVPSVPLKIIHDNDCYNIKVIVHVILCQETNYEIAFAGY
jgi:hypothetical protein